jgi:hypothetical protein
VARVAPLDDVVRSAAHEPDATQVRAHNERLRRDGYTRIIGHLASRFGLSAGLNPADAVDILLTLAGPATYRSLVADYHWPPRPLRRLARGHPQPATPPSFTAGQAGRAQLTS